MRHFEPYQTDVLFLLIGANPLPNYVAVLLLAKPEATVYLLHTRDTAQFANWLERRLVKQRPGLSVILWQIDQADGQKIECQIAEITPPSGRVGLNYTGGTKPMSVHTYHVLRDRFPKGCFSYLNASSLKMFFLGQGGNPTRALAVGQAVKLDFEALLSLHGYTLKDPPRQTARHTALCKAIANVNSNPDGFEQWREWVECLGEDTTLPTLERYPALAPAIKTIIDLCGGQTPTETIVAQALGHPALKNCIKFFLGEWLEEYTFDALDQFADALSIEHRGIDLELQAKGKRGFQIDMAAIYGYQLFALSCMVTKEAAKAKEHLFEVFVRARQIGGDEARIGLVCCVKNPKALQREIEREWEAEGKVRVFGQRDLPRLAGCLREWFETANKG